MVEAPHRPHSWRVLVTLHVKPGCRGVHLEIPADSGQQTRGQLARSARKPSAFTGASTCKERSSIKPCGGSDQPQAPSSHQQQQRPEDVSWQRSGQRALNATQHSAWALLPTQRPEGPGTYITHFPSLLGDLSHHALNYSAPSSPVC